MHPFGLPELGQPRFATFTSAAAGGVAPVPQSICARTPTVQPPFNTNDGAEVSPQGAPPAAKSPRLRTTGTVAVPVAVGE